eukprot:292924-Chlamydomonas_euryale.AAC.1
MPCLAVTTTQPTHEHQTQQLGPLIAWPRQTSGCTTAARRVIRTDASIYPSIHPSVHPSIKTRWRTKDVLIVEASHMK